jgi:MFS family permease
MNIYGGLLVNFSTWQRSLLIWSLPLGVATSLTAVRLGRQRWQIMPGLSGAIAGLLILAAGMYHSYERTLEWPYWQIQNVADLNWFPAPQYWELAPGRFLMGLGIGLFMIAMDMLASPDPDREERTRPFLLVTQFYGSGIGIAVLVNFFLIGHPINYSYIADRDYIQADELAQRRAVLGDALDQAGEQAPGPQADALLFRTANCEADNLVYAQFYAAFAFAAVGLAALCLGLLIWRRRRPRRGPQVQLA